MSKYSKKLANKICSLIKSDTYTIAEICLNVGISERSYYEWQKNNAEFAELLAKSNDDRMKFFAAEAKKSLLKKIQGYTIQEKRVVMIEGKADGEGKTKPKIKEQTIIDKHFQPDTAAIIFTLTNQEPENWKNRYNNEITGKDGKDLFAGMTDEDLNKRIEELEKKLTK